MIYRWFKNSLLGLGAAVIASQVLAQTIYPARELVTLSEADGNAIYVIGDRIQAVGELEALKADYPQAQIDERYRDKVIVPGFIEHHVHPFLAAISLGASVIAIEDWDLPDAFRPGVRDGAGYRERLRSELAKTPDDGSLFITWGYHHYFHETLERDEIDALAGDRPVLIIHRSFHEFILNSAAIEFFGINPELIAAAPASAQPYMNLQTGVFAEQGAIAIVGKVLPKMMPQFMRGLHQLSAYLHANGVTMIGNPGAMYDPQLQAAKDAVLGAETTPFRSHFIVSGMMLAARHPMSELLTRTEEIVQNWGKGRVDYLPKQIKLFSDGAMFSQAMQMRQGYLDGHDGAWLMDKEKFEISFRLYWDAGYQIHVHHTGDAGLDRVLEALGANMQRAPRDDHRTVLVHFGFAASDQIERAQKLGAVVSANPYYVTALSDLYSRRGIGPDAHNMVPLGEAERAGLPIALHSDMPMAPAAPLFLMHQAVNRVNFAGDVAGPQHRLSVEAAFRGITDRSAFMMRLEDAYGTIDVGKFANLTILQDNPLTIAHERIKDIPVIATMVEGQNYPVRSNDPIKAVHRQEK